MHVALQFARRVLLAKSKSSDGTRFARRKSVTVISIANAAPPSVMVLGPSRTTRELFTITFMTELRAAAADAREAGSFNTVVDDDDDVNSTKSDGANSMRSAVGVPE